ncbi:hypothetical protein LguiB_029446 [Lonicera macranthoides]
MDLIVKSVPGMEGFLRHRDLPGFFRVDESADNSTVAGSFWEEDRSCIKWLNSQPSKSVIYVSFGSATILTRDELMEFWYGLANSGVRFLWVMRPDSITGKDGERQIPAEVEEGTRERGYMVGWAPQEEVLDHPATINSRFVSEVWKLGLDMKDVCDRAVIEKAVRDVMVDRKEEFLKKANEKAKMARNAISEGGSSFCNLENLIEFIGSMIA